MSRYEVAIRCRPGVHVHRTVRARTHAAAYELVQRERLRTGDHEGTELAVVTRRGLRRSAQVIEGRPGPDDGGTAGVREPRRPDPRLPGLRAARHEH